MPLVAHETGQFSVFPDLREIPRYTGVVRARNFEQDRETLVRHGMIDQAHDFLRASGALAADLYKEDQERYLRTPGFGGFQVLDLQDFPGQGTALVGMLNAFLEDKGVTTPAAWRRSCAPVTVLARFDRCVWTTGQLYKADLVLAHYGASDWNDVSTEWTVVDAAGDVLARGAFAAARLAQGKVHPLGRVEVPLAAVAAPARLELRVESRAGAGGRSDGLPSLERAENRWAFWVYPAAIVQPAAPEVLVAKAWDAAVEQRLAAGGRVLLMPSGEDWGHALKGGYATDYWSWNFFHNQPGTLGLLIDEHHPALAGFPTRFYSEREWSAIAHAAHPVILSALPPGTRPIVQVIDNPVRCERLGLVFELAVVRGGCWSARPTSTRSPRAPGGRPAPRQPAGLRGVARILPRGPFGFARGCGPVQPVVRRRPPATTRRRQPAGQDSDASPFVGGNTALTNRFLIPAGPWATTLGTAGSINSSLERGVRRETPANPPSLRPGPREATRAGTSLVWFPGAPRRGQGEGRIGFPWPARQVLTRGRCSRVALLLGDPNWIGNASGWIKPWSFATAS